MRVLLINQFGPPDTSPTSRLVADVAEHLQAQGHDVQVVCYSSEVSGYRRRYRGMWRLVAESLALVSLVGKALWAGPQERIIVFSSPPMVVLAGVLASWVHRCSLTHWVLDAYPDVANALGAGGPEWLQTVWKCLMQFAYQKCDQVVAVSHAMQRKLQQSYGIKSSVIYPWPPLIATEKTKRVEWKLVPAGYKIWCYSGNLGKAHEWSVLLDVQQELEKRSVTMALVVQGGGSGWKQLQQESRNRGLKHVYFEDYVQEQDLVSRLHSATVRVATLKKQMSGLLWPSKWALIDCLPGPHLWIGPRTDLAESDTWTKQFDVEEYRAIASWLEQTPQSRPEWESARFKESVDRKRLEGLTEWKNLVEVSAK